MVARWLGHCATICFLDANLALVRTDLGAAKQHADDRQVVRALRGMAVIYRTKGVPARKKTRKGLRPLFIFRRRGTAIPSV